MNKLKVLIRTDKLSKYYGKRDDIKAVEELDLKIYKGETLGILGPSGSGKSVLTRSILRLVKFPGKIEKGQVLYLP